MRIPGYPGYSYIDGKVYSHTKKKYISKDKRGRVRLRNKMDPSPDGLLKYVDDIKALLLTNHPSKMEGVKTTKLGNVWITKNGEIYQDFKGKVKHVRQKKDQDRYIYCTESGRMYLTMHELTNLALDEIESSRYRRKRDKENQRALNQRQTEKKTEKKEAKNESSMERKMRLQNERRERARKKAERELPRMVPGFSYYELNNGRLISRLSGKPREMPEREVYVLMDNIGNRKRMMMDEIKELVEIEMSMN